MFGRYALLCVCICFLSFLFFFPLFLIYIFALFLMESCVSYTVYICNNFCYEKYCKINQFYCLINNILLFLRRENGCVFIYQTLFIYIHIDTCIHTQHKCVHKYKHSIIYTYIYNEKHTQINLYKYTLNIFKQRTYFYKYKVT